MLTCSVSARASLLIPLQCGKLCCRAQTLLLQFLHTMDAPPPAGTALLSLPGSLPIWP